MSEERKSWPIEAVRARTGREVPDLLRDLYVEKRHTDQEIADALGVSRSLVRQWRERFGITRDDRAPVDLEATA